MPSTGAPFDWSLVDIAVAPPSDRLPGISMAGFRHRASAFVDIAMVAHPSVSLLIDLSEGEGLVHHTRGRRGRGSVVIGLLPGELRTGGRVGDSGTPIRLSRAVICEESVCWAMVSAAAARPNFD